MTHMPMMERQQPLINIIINQGKESKDKEDDEKEKENPLKKILENRRIQKMKISRDMMIKMLSSRLKNIEENTRTKRGQTNFIGGSI